MYEFENFNIISCCMSLLSKLPIVTKFQIKIYWPFFIFLNVCLFYKIIVSYQVTSCCCWSDVAFALTFSLRELRVRESSPYPSLLIFFQLKFIDLNGNCVVLLLGDDYLPLRHKISYFVPRVRFLIVGLIHIVERQLTVGYHKNKYLRK